MRPCFASPNIGHALKHYPIFCRQLREFIRGFVNLLGLFCCELRLLPQAAQHGMDYILAAGAVFKIPRKRISPVPVKVVNVVSVRAWPNKRLCCQIMNSLELEALGGAFAEP